jgi:DNA-binding transcriptional ArsR family regulator
MPKSHAHSNAFRKVLRTFALFGHPLRVVIFQRLARRPQSAGDLARELPVSRTAVVQHLKRLEAEGMVKTVRSGRRQIYSIDPGGLAPLAHWVAAHRKAI